MSDSIYKVSSWNGGTPYMKNDIVLHNSNYYYSLVDNNANNTPSTSSNIYWHGYRAYANFAKPYFFWEPTYASQLKTKPSINVIKFGNGYEQRTEDGVNNSLLQFDLIFEGREEKEARAIVHFFQKRKGAISFFYNPPFPYNFDDSQNYPKRFFCEEWTLNFNFYNNYRINASFTETPTV